MIRCYHGSPGNRLDFSFLGDDWKIAFENDESEQQSDVCIGYSWGCSQALLQAVSSLTIKKLILISPYISIEKPISPAARILLTTPAIGTLTLKFFSQSIIDKFLKKSSFPSDPSPSYQAYGELLKDPKLLKSAALEKRTYHWESIFEVLRENEVSIHVIYGDSDQTSNPNVQIQALKKTMNHLYSETIITGGGHALPWTHGEELKRILTKLIPPKKGESNG